jgi:hypothetical protein
MILQIDLASLFAAPLTITAATEMTLPGTQPLAGVPKQTYTADGGASFTVPIVPPAPSGPGLTITISAQQIRTFLCTIG